MNGAMPVSYAQLTSATLQLKNVGVSVACRQMLGDLIRSSLFLLSPPSMKLLRRALVAEALKPGAVEIIYEEASPSRAARHRAEMLKLFGLPGHEAPRLHAFLKGTEFQSAELDVSTSSTLLHWQTVLPFAATHPQQDSLRLEETTFSGSI